LHAVLKWIDRQNPAASKLLTAARGPHGPAKTPVFTDQQVFQYRRMLEWAYLVTQQPLPEATPDPFAEFPAVGAAEQREESGQPRTLPTTRSARPLPRPERRSHADAVPASATEAADGETAIVPKPAKPLHAAMSTAKKDAKSDKRPGRPTAPPGDPFDPEIFNRQFAPAGDPSQAPPNALPTPAAQTRQGKAE
jgi:hypothetical protein